MADGGSLVSLTSLNARQPGTGLAAYCAAKAGLVALTEVTAPELGPRRVRVNAVAPGLVVTPLTAPAMDIPGVRTAAQTRIKGRSRERRDLRREVRHRHRGGSGIGAALTRALVAAGADVVCADLDLSAAERTVADLGGPGSARAALVDVTDAEQVRQAVDDVDVNIRGVVTACTRPARRWSRRAAGTSSTPRRREACSRPAC